MAAACVVFAFLGFCIGGSCSDVPRIITTMMLMTELATLAGLIVTVAFRSGRTTSVTAALWEHFLALGSPERRGDTGIAHCCRRGRTRVAG